VSELGEDRMDWKIMFGAVALLPTTAHGETGPVTVWFAEDMPTVSDKLAILCANRDATVIEQDDRHVLCQRAVSGGKGVIAQSMLGNSYSTSPQLMIRFQVLRDGKAARVQASQWIELQTAGGQVRRTDLNGSKQRMELENILIDAGGHNAPIDLASALSDPATPPHE
jgi:hypothetical protein